MFYDVHCSVSRRFHRNFEQFLNSPFEDGTFLDQIRVVYHYFPLPYPRHAYAASVIIPRIADLRGPEGAVAYASWMLEQQDAYLGALGAQLSEEDTIDLLCSSLEAAPELFSMSASECRQVYSNDTSGAESRARTSWKFAAYSDVTGTP